MGHGDRHFPGQGKPVENIFGGPADIRIGKSDCGFCVAVLKAVTE
jgi:hypothetical protein